MITIQNNFHNTTVNLKADFGQQLTLSQTRRMNRVLCGVKGCKCGAGHRDSNVDIDYTGVENGVFLPTFTVR